MCVCVCWCVCVCVCVCVSELERERARGLRVVLAEMRRELEGLAPVLRATGLFGVQEKTFRV